MQGDQEKINAIKDAYKVLEHALNVAIGSGLTVTCSIDATDTYYHNYSERVVRGRKISAVRTIT